MAGTSQHSGRTHLRKNSDIDPANDLQPSTADGTMGIPQASLIESFGGSPGESGMGQMGATRPGLAQESSIGEIHSLY